MDIYYLYALRVVMSLVGLLIDKKEGKNCHTPVRIGIISMQDDACAKNKYISIESTLFIPIIEYILRCILIYYNYIKGSGNIS